MVKRIVTAGRLTTEVVLLENQPTTASPALYQLYTQSMKGPKNYFSHQKAEHPFPNVEPRLCGLQAKRGELQLSVQPQLQCVFNGL